MLSWLGNDAFILEDLAFRIGVPPADVTFPERFSKRTFSVLKQPWLINQYVDLFATLEPRNILELGIWSGGGTAFLATLAKAQKYVAIDLVDSSTETFRDWLRTGPQKDHAVAHFGVDQSDGTTLRAIAADEFGGEPLDLVIDDASHALAPTRASFEALFPLLRPGGVYVIEDWDSQHRMDKALGNELDSNPALRAQVEEQLSRESPESWQPLTRLIVQIMLASAYTEIIDDIRIRRGSVMIRRGPEDFDQDGFLISDFYQNLGRELLQEDSAQRSGSS